MKIPVVLPVVHVSIDEAGALTIDVDGEPYDNDRTLFRDDLRTALAAITSEREGAVRVEVKESDGTTYADIATPPEAPSHDMAATPAAASSLPGVSGTGFEPGEQVVLAYVLLHGTADGAGKAVVHLPPSLMADRCGAMVLLGLESKVSALLEASA